MKVTGVTIHFVDEGMDTGPIIAQEAVASIHDEDTRETLQERIQQTEHKLYPAVLAEIIVNNKIDLRRRD